MLLATTVGACAPVPPSQRQPADTAVNGLPADVDHVILAIDSLERGIALLREATGLTATFGGAHPGRGTQNALLGLGPRVYLELLAPNPQDAAGAAQLAEFARFRALTPVGWAMRTHNADSLRSLLVARGAAGGGVRGGARQRPGGATLRWRSVNPWPGSSRLLPFFIEWDSAGPHPSDDAPSGCTLAALALASPTADSIRTLLGHAGISLPVSYAPRDGMSMTLDCGGRRIHFPTHSP